MIGTMMGVIAGIILPLVGVWVTTRALSAATESDDAQA